MSKSIKGALGSLHHKKDVAPFATRPMGALRVDGRFPALDEKDVTEEDMEKLLALKMMHLNQTREVEQTRTALGELHRKRLELEALRNSVMKAIETGDILALEDIQRKAQDLERIHTEKTIDVAAAFTGSDLDEFLDEEIDEHIEYQNDDEPRAPVRRLSFTSTLTALKEEEEEEEETDDVDESSTLVRSVDEDAVPEDVSSEELANFLGHMMKLDDSNKNLVEQMEEVKAIDSMRSTMLDRLIDLRNESAEEHKLRKEELGLLEKKQNELRELRSQLMVLRGLGEELQRVYDEEEEEVDEEEKPNVPLIEDKVEEQVMEEPTPAPTSELLLDSAEVQERFKLIQEQQGEILALKEKLEELQSIKSQLVEKQRQILDQLSTNESDTSEKLQTTVEIARESLTETLQEDSNEETPEVGDATAEDEEYRNDLSDMENRLEDLKRRQAALKQFGRHLEAQVTTAVGSTSTEESIDTMDDSPFSLIDERETIDQLIARLTACSADLLNPRVSSASVQTSPDDLRTALIQRLNVTPPARRWGVEEEEMMEISGGPRGDVAMAAEVKVGEEVYVSSEDILKRAFEQEEEYGEVDYGSDDDEDEKEEAEDEDLEEGGDLVEITERQLEATSKEINDSIESILKQVSEIESERARITDPEHLSYYVDYFNKLSSSLEELLSARERIAMYREVIKMRKEQGSYGDLLADSDDETEKVEEKQVETGGETPALAAEAPAPSVAVETTEVNASNAVEKVELKPPTVEKIETPAPIAETPKDASPLLQLKQAWAETEKSVPAIPNLLSGIKDDLYQQAATTLSKLEAEPYFLLQLFRNVQKLSTPMQRQRLMLALDMIVREEEEVTVLEPLVVEGGRRDAVKSLLETSEKETGTIDTVAADTVSMNEIHVNHPNTESTEIHTHHPKTPVPIAPTKPPPSPPLHDPFQQFRFYSLFDDTLDIEAAAATLMSSTLPPSPAILTTHHLTSLSRVTTLFLVNRGVKEECGMLEKVMIVEGVEVDTARRVLHREVVGVLRGCLGALKKG